MNSLRKKNFINKLLQEVTIPWEREQCVSYLIIVSKNSNVNLDIDESLNLLGFMSLCIKFLTGEILRVNRAYSTAFMKPEGDYTVEQAFLGLKDPEAVITFKEKR